MEKERVKRLNLKAKVNEAKLQRDLMLQEAYQKRQRESSETRFFELNQKEKLQREIIDEKVNLREKRRRELEAARRVIEENEQEKKKRLEQAMRERESDAKLIELEIKAKID